VTGPVPFAKAHGLGNDFILVDEQHCPADAAAWARRLCDRHVGIGGDGVVVYRKEPDALRMRLINADGGEAEISGNGVRCLAALGVAKGWMPPRHEVRTVAGPRAVEVAPLGGSRFRVATDLGPAVLDSRAIPVALEPAAASVVDHPLLAAGRPLRVTATSLGNPHCAVFLDSVADDALVRALGPELESHPFFPRKTNVEFVTVTAPDALRVRFWERGVGPTRASGTGAASAAVAAVLKGLTGRRVRVECDGGVLDVEWPDGGTVRQVGEAEILFEGDWLAATPGGDRV
jgi:diaminopimelate epimerase